MLKTTSRRSIGRSLAALVAGLMITGTSFAEAVNINGFIDTQYGYSFTKPQDQTNSLRSFDSKDNTFRNTTQLNVNGGFEDVTYVVKFLAGSDAGVITSSNSGTADDFDLQEAYFVYTCPKSGMMLKAGKFVTTEGIEVIESKDNATITRGYLFGLAEPYTHVGALVSKAFGKVELGAGLVNGWDATPDNNKGKTAIYKLAYNGGDPLTVTLSGTYGPEQNGPNGVNGNNRSSTDLTGVTKLLPKTALWFQYNYGTERRAVNSSMSRGTWQGVTVQPIVSLTDKASIGARAEYFADPDGARTSTADQYITNYTITPGYKLTDHVTVRAEFRHDQSNKKSFKDDKGVMKDTANSATLQWLFTF